MTAVHKGGRRVGERIVIVDVGFYVAWRAGDHAFLFLDQTGRLVPSGLKLVRGSVLAFWQPDNPGPYVALDPAYAMNRHAFRGLLRQSLIDVPQLARRLQGDARELLSLYTWRLTRASHGCADVIAGEAAERLADVGDLELVDRALRLENTCWSRFRALAMAFANPAGREHALARVLDDREPLEERLRFVRVLTR